MGRRTVKAACLILEITLVLGLTSGCWDALDVDDRDICTAVVVDRQGDDYTFFVEIPSITARIQRQESGQGGGQSLNTVIAKGSGTTYAEARMNLDKVLNKPLYLGAVQSLILTEALADSGIEEYTLRLRQMIEYRKTMDVIVTPDKPEELLGLQPENEATVGFAVEDSLESMTKLGLTYHLSLADLLQKLESKNPCYLMNTMSVKAGQLSVTGSAVFSGGKRRGFIPFEESRGIAMLIAHGSIKPKFDYVVTVDGYTFTLETTLKNRKITARYDGVKPSFDVTLHFDARGLYPSGKVRITEALRGQTAGKLKEDLTNELLRTIERSQKEYESDYLSFSEPFRIAYPDAYEEMNWHDEFKKAEFNVEADVKVLPNRSVDYNPKPEIQ